MDISGEYRISASRETVWQALNDPEILQACIPGCDEIVKTSDTELDAKVTAKVGPVKAKFTGHVTLSDLDPPNGYRISGEGKGGAVGFAKGGADVTLEEADGETILRYTANATVGGKLAQIGSRLIDSTARKMADQFFSAFAEKVGGTAESMAEGTAEAAAAAPEAPVAASPAPAPTVAAAAEEPAKGIRPAIWVVGLIAVVVILLIVFGR